VISSVPVLVLSLDSLSLYSCFYFIPLPGIETTGVGGWRWWRWWWWWWGEGGCSAEFSFTGLLSGKQSQRGELSPEAPPKTANPFECWYRAALFS